MIVSYSLQVVFSDENGMKGAIKMKVFNVNKLKKTTKNPVADIGTKARLKLKTYL